MARWHEHHQSSERLLHRPELLRPPGRSAAVGGQVLGSARREHRLHVASAGTSIGAQSQLSAQQLHRTLGLTYKTAWRMARRISEAMLHENPDRVLTALWLQWILLGEQKRGNQEEVVVTDSVT